MTTLGEVCSVVSSLVDPKVSPYAELPHVAPDSIASGGGLAGHLVSASEAGVTSGKYHFQPGDVLYSKIRPALNKAVLIGFEGVCSADMYALRVDPKRLDSRYLLHRLRSPEFVAYATSRSGRLSIPKINRQSLFEYPLQDLPPIEEQRRIAAILDHADSLRTASQRFFREADGVAKHLFLRDFGTLAPTAAIDRVANYIRTGPFGSQLLHSEFVDDGVAVLGLDNVVSNEFRWVERRFITPEKYGQLRRYTVQPKDVLISIMGTTGRCVVVPQDFPTAINTKHICAITLDQDVAVPEFLRAVFLWHAGTRSYLRQRNKGAIMDGLNMGVIKSMPIPLPPLAEQQAYARECEAIADGRLKADRQADHLNALFKSLQARAFSGRL